MSRFSFGLAVLLAACVTPAQAEVSYELFFRGSGLTDSNNAMVVAAPGQMFDDVEIYVRETSMDPNDSLLADYNITSYRYTVSAIGGGSFSDLRTDAAGGTASVDPTELRFTAFSFAGQPGKPSTSPSVGVREARLGSFDLTAGTDGTLTMFSVVRTNGLPDDIGTIPDMVVVPGIGAGESVGLSTYANFTGGTYTDGFLSLQVAAIPEPSSLALIAGVLGTAAVRRFRRKK